MICAVLFISAWAALALFRPEWRPPSPHRPLPEDSAGSPTDGIAGSPPPPQRGKPISALIAAGELYDAYRQIEAEYNAKAFTVEDEERNGGGAAERGEKKDGAPSSAARWRILRETSDGIQIALLSHPSDPTCPYVRMRAVAPGSVREVWDFLALANWERTMPHMDPFYEGVTLLGHYVHRGVDMILARKRTTRIVTFGKRDFTFVSVSDVPRSDGVWVSGTVSVVTPKLPRERGYVRAFQDSVAFYEPLPPDPETGDGRTRLTIVCRIDLNDSGEGGEGGAMPMWIYVRTVGASGVASMRSLRRQLVLDRAERREKEEREREEERRREREL